MSPLVAAAAPLLQLLARLRNTLNQPDPGDLRERAVRAMRAFEQRVRDLGIPIEQLPPAHYALCASLDDVVLNTPWGSTGVWAARSLVSTFHQEVRSGERFFELLGQMRQHPGRFLPVIELMYLCMSLGFQGQYRLSPRGPAELDRLREETYALIVRQRPAAEPDLSPHSQGVAAPYRPMRATIPVWVAGSAALAAIAGLFVWFLLSINAASDKLFTRMLNVPPAHMPQLARAAPIEPLPPPVLPAGRSAVRVSPARGRPGPRRRVVHIADTHRAHPQPRHVRSGQRHGRAPLHPAAQPYRASAEGGEGKRAGDRLHRQSADLHNVQFPSNFHLSVARAQAAKNILGNTVGDASRLTAEGRGESDPIASNATLEGREQNRRIEIVVHRRNPTP